MTTPISSKGQPKGRTESPKDVKLKKGFSKEALLTVESDNFGVNIASGFSNSSSSLSSYQSKKYPTKDQLQSDSSHINENGNHRIHHQPLERTTSKSQPPNTSIKDSDHDIDPDLEDAPVEKSFKQSKLEAIQKHHSEHQGAKLATESGKEKRRTRTQMLQEQSRQHKPQSAKEEEEESNSSEENDALDTEVLRKAAISNSMDVDQLESKPLQVISDIRREKKKAQRETIRKQFEQIESKAVTVVPLMDSNGNFNMSHRRNVASQAEAFLKEHLWGTRLERLRGDLYLSERSLGPAKQFAVIRSRPTKESETSNMKKKRQDIVARMSKNLRQKSV